MQIAGKTLTHSTAPEASVCGFHGLAPRRKQQSLSRSHRQVEVNTPWRQHFAYHLIYLQLADAIYVEYILLKSFCSILHSCGLSINSTQCQPVETADGGFGRRCLESHSTYTPQFLLQIILLDTSSAEGWDGWDSRSVEESFIIYMG